MSEDYEETITELEQALTMVEAHLAPYFETPMAEITKDLNSCTTKARLRILSIIIAKGNILKWGSILNSFQTV